MNYFITDDVNEHGVGRFTLEVTGDELSFLLAEELVYEDTESEYLEVTGRRHFHPNHENTTAGELLVELERYRYYKEMYFEDN